MDLTRTGILPAKAENVSEEDATYRLRGGIMMLAIALAGAVGLETIDAGPLWRLLLFVPFFLAEYSFFQAVYRICGVTALQGKRWVDDGWEQIADPQVREACRCLGKTQLFASLGWATLLTGLFVWLAF